MGEDSGYFSHRSHHFRLAREQGTHHHHHHHTGGRTAAYDEDLSRLSFDDLRSPEHRHYLRYGFTDEEDFEEFKRELAEFRRLKRAARASGAPGEDLSSSSAARGGGEGGGGGSGGQRRSLSSALTGASVGVGRCSGDGGSSGGTVSDTASLPAQPGGGGGGGGRDEGADRAWREGGGREEHRCSDDDGGGVDLTEWGRRGSHRWSGERTSSSSSSCPRQPTSPVSASAASGISFREGGAGCGGGGGGGGGGGARAKEVDKRRNGVYFEDDCVVRNEEVVGGGGCGQLWQGGDRRGRGSPCSAHTPDPPSFAARSGERRSSAGGGGNNSGSGGQGQRRVSFRDTPERFTIREGIPQSLTDPDDAFRRQGSEEEEDLSSSDRARQHLSSWKGEAEPRRGSDFAEDLSRSRQSAGRKHAHSGEERSFSAESWRDGCELDSARRTWPSLGREGTSGQWSQAVEIPIRLVSQPVSRPDSSRTQDLRSLSVDDDRLIGSHSSFRGDSARPPRDPSSVLTGAEARARKDRSSAGHDPAVTVLRKLADRQNSDPLPTPSRDRGGQEGKGQPGESGDPRHSQTYHHPKRSSLLETLRRLSGYGRPRSGRGTDPWMDLFGGEEPFQEFERVFETINSPRLSRDLDMRRPGSSWRDEVLDRDSGDGDDLGILHIDEDFLDFFDHDEDFMEFERELENIKSNRRSKLLENLHRRSSCDIFEDVKSFCDRNLRRNSTPTSSPKVERRLSATHSGDKDLWNSAEEWDLVMNKLRRNSRLLSDQALNSGAGARAGAVGEGERSGLEEETSRNRTLPASFLDRPYTAARSHLCPGLKDCQYTCHLSCVPSVTLDCTTVSPGSGGGPVATPTDLPSPSSDLPSPTASAETSLIERRTIVNHRSPHKVPPASTSSSSTNSPSMVRTVSPSVHPLMPSSGTCGKVCSSPSVSCIRDPLSGACVSMTTSLPGASSVCVEKDLNQNAKPVENGLLAEHRMGDDVCDVSNEKDETDSGYRSGTIPEEKLPKAPSQATLNRMELRRKIQTFNHFVPGASLEPEEDGESFQGFLRVTLNLIRPITMELGARPPSIYELLTREHIVEQSTQHVAFYMPRDTVKSIHISSKTTTKEVVANLLKKFHILDHPRKFAMYEQEFSDKNKLVKLRRLTDKDCPLVAMLTWQPEQVKHYRLVLQENETGEIVWENFSEPELQNFHIVLNREEKEAIAQLQYKYRVMKRIILQRMKELRQEKHASKESTA